jgi:hypothetical protein
MDLIHARPKLGTTWRLKLERRQPFERVVDIIYDSDVSNELLYRYGRVGDKEQLPPKVTHSIKELTVDFFGPNMKYRL